MDREAELEELANTLILAAGRLRQLCLDTKKESKSRAIAMPPSITSSPKKPAAVRPVRQTKLSREDRSRRVLAVVGFLVRRGANLASRSNIALLSGFLPSDPLYNGLLEELLANGSLVYFDGSFKVDVTLEATLPPATLSEMHQAIESVIESLPAKQRALMRLLWEKQGRPASTLDLAAALGRAADAKLRTDLADLVKRSLAEHSSGRFSCNEILLIS